MPNPPPGFVWDDISFVIGGYLHMANFVDSQGFLLTDGTAGVNTQWNLAWPPTQTPAQFAPYPARPGHPPALHLRLLPLPHHRPQPRGPPDGPARHPGHLGPARHPVRGLPRPRLRGTSPTRRANIYVNPTAAFCGQCHSRQPNGPVQAANGFILHEQQYPELQASPHAPMQCVTCHNPHASPNYDPANALVNDCQNCHADHNMALHAGKVLTTGNYTETLTCHSCHMPYATVAATSAVIDGGRIGDVRTHIFRINPAAAGLHHHVQRPRRHRSAPTPTARPPSRSTSSASAATTAQAMPLP